MLDGYARHHPRERDVVARIRTLVESHPDCFLRTCLPGHVTASAWILSADLRWFLLTHHAKLDRWLQLGGHADGDPDVRRVAEREAREESGMARFTRVSDLPLDVDVHEIPARGAEPAHEHHDVRFLLIAAAGQELRVSSESHALRWFPRGAARELAADDSVLRMVRKVEAWLGSRGPGGARVQRGAW
jgi:8-oxo-dGTP pyrophosphatase MutT (NUDIX family)